jgi:drug/metabolite transporter (DMT)-like permease
MALIAGAVGLARLGWRHAAALALGFAGAAAVIGGAGGAVDPLGATIAFGAGFGWSLFCVFRMGPGATAGEVLAGACAAGAVVSAAIHLAVETTVAPSAGAALAVVAIGVAPLALANHLWDLGVRRGDGRALAVAAYGTPLLSAMLLAALELAEPSAGLALGAGLIVAAGMVAARAG